MTTLMQLLEHQAQQHPEKVSIRRLVRGELHDPVELTFGELWIGARAVAAHLQARGVEREPVLLLHSDAETYVTSLFGCILAGAIAAPCYPPERAVFRRAAPRLQAIAESSGARVALADSGLVELGQRLLPSMVWLDGAADGAEVSWKRPVLHEDDPALIQYTSGSTATPRGVVVGHGNLIHNARVITERLGLREGGGVNWLPLVHDMGLVGCVVAPISVGATSTLMAPMDFLRRPARWLAAIDHFRAGVNGAPDFGYQLLARRVPDQALEGLDLSCWHTAFCGAERVRPATLAAVAERLKPAGFQTKAFYPCYGLAEATLLVSGPGRDRDAPVIHDGQVACGTPADDTEIRIVDGEIWVRGPGVASGYWNDPEATEATFGGRLDAGGPWLRTGDLGTLDAEGRLVPTGRLKDLLILRGRNVSPEDVEGAALNDPGVRPGGAAAFPVEIEGEERAVLALEPEGSLDDLDPEALGAALRRRVAEATDVELHAVWFLRRGQLPRTSSGKVQRSAVREAFGAGGLAEVARVVFEGRTAVAEPKPETVEQAVAVLQRLVAPHAPESVDPSTSLAALGIDSVQLVELATRVEDVFQRPVEVAAFFRAPDLRALAAQLLGQDAARSPSAPPSGHDSPYVDIGAACARIDARSLRYRFELEALPWQDLDAPGRYATDELLGDLGVDVEAVRARPGAMPLLQWAWALQVCRVFEYLEVLVVDFATREQQALGATRSAALLVEEEDKHIWMFRRYAQHLTARHPVLAERLLQLAPLDALGRRYAEALDGRTPAERHYLTWLMILLFEETTVWLHDMLQGAADVQPCWLAVHAAHRQEEIQHVVTDAQYLGDLDLGEASRQRLAASFGEGLLADFDTQLGIGGASALVEAEHPGLRVLADDPRRSARSLERLLSHKALRHTSRLPFFRDLREGSRPADGIAVVGLGCRLPGAPDPAAFWELLRTGGDAITEVPPTRWDLETWYDPDPTAPGRMYTRWGGFLEGIEDFDADFFGISPVEARGLDPQQRLLLEVAWEALEHAGVRPSSLRGTATGVFVGIASHDYERRSSRAELNAYSVTGTVGSVAAGRLSYVLGLHGPCLAVDTACSSSLVAVHLAARSLADGECDTALAAGVNVVLDPEGTVYFCKLRAMSPTGRCRSFDATADGYVRSEGCGVVVLKRLADAERDGDRILAVIEASATNQDGRSNGLTAPNATAQTALIRAALQRAGRTPDEVGYVEAHGTGTPVGDPIEAQAIGAAFAARRRPLPIGTVKSQVGHSEAAAGITALIKAVLVLRHGWLPGNPHLKTPTPHVPWSELPLEPLAEGRSWHPDEPRVIGVNSFGFGGTNAHVLLSAGPAPRPPARALPGPRPIVLSGRAPEAVRALAARIDDPAAARTLATGREPFEWRAAAPDPAGLKDAPVVRASRPARVGFLFSGQGAQHVYMAAGLDAACPTFRRALDAVDAALEPHLGRPIRSVLMSGDVDIDDTALAQPALFAVEVALARMWMDWGVVPDVVVGHSVGEIAVACVAGLLPLDEAARLVVARGRLMSALPRGGAMIAAEVDEATVRSLLRDFGGAVQIAAVNAPSQTTLSGETHAVAAIGEELRRLGIQVRQLVVSHAFHSARMDPVLQPLGEVAGSLRIGSPAIPICDALGGRPMGQPTYWVDQARRPVRFLDALNRARSEHGVEVLVEVGPRPVLLGLAAASGSEVRVASLRPGRPDVEVVTEALCQLHTAGLDLRWDEVFGDEPIVDAPTTPFQRQRHWIDAAPAATAGVRAEHPLLGQRLDLADQAMFETALSTSSPAWLADHVVAGQPVAPGALWLELARAAAAQVAKAAVELHDCTFDRALVLDPAPTRVQVGVGDDLTVRVHARKPDGWVRVASARAALLAAEAAPISPPPEGEVIEGLYDRLEGLGLAYGPAFRGVERLETCGDTATAWLVPQDDGLPLHPAHLDAALHTAGAVLDAGAELRLPVAVKRYRVLREGGGTRAVATRTGDGVRVQLCDAGGAPVAEVEGLQLRAVTPAALGRRPDAWAVEWVPTPVPPERGSLSGPWRVVGAGELADALRGALDTAAEAELVVFVADPATAPSEPIEALAGWIEDLLAERGAIYVVTLGDVAGTGLWGLGRTLMQERPPCRLIDLGGSSDPLADVLSELRRRDDEDQVRYRGGQRLAARLRRADVRLPRPPGPGWHVQRGPHGLLDELSLAPIERASPGPGQVEIAVEAAGLNFRDVLNALGRYPGPPSPLGGECAGRVSAIGPGVDHVAVGDAVMALAPAALGSFVQADAATTVRVPRGLAPTEAASLPVAFATAWYALVDVARVKPGERVLVHAAAGGVGMATVQLARHLGCEVVGTASPRKQAIVRSLGAEDVASSREPGFEEAFEPVDVVVNSLVGDFIPASLRLLRPGGRFVELGKAEVWTDEQVRAVRSDVAYTAFDLALVPPERLGAILASVADAVASGALRPLPVEPFALDDAVSAFRHMARAGHVGKIVLTAEEPGFAPRAGERWLVTGGRGALGQHVARWLTERGAEVVLAGRAEADLSDRASVAALLDRVGPLAGIVHAAGVLDDAPLAEQTPERVARVLGAKALGAWHLHELTRQSELRHFVLFSSVAGTLGSVGQAGYAAANAFLDGLAEHRRALGLPATSIAWGPWAGEGMGASLTPAQWRRMATLGIRALSPADALAMLEQALGSPRPTRVAASLDLGRLRQRLAAQVVPTVLRELVTPSADADDDIVERLVGLAPLDRAPALITWLQQRASHVLGGGSVPVDRPLQDLGLDSLMAADLHNDLCRGLSRRLPDTALLDHPTLQELAPFLITDLLGLDGGAAAADLVDAIAASAPEDDLDAELRQLEDLL